MKKTLLTAALAFMGMAAMAQSGSGFGIKAGLNYTQNGDLGIDISDVFLALPDIKESNGKIGFHVGVFGKLDLVKFYIRPELVYTQTKSDYDLNDSSIDYDISKLDLPVLFGFKVIGPLHVFAGPAFQYILDNDLEDLNVEDVENDFSVGLNVGVGVNLGGIGLDVRYERGFSENEANFIGDNIADISGRVDSRPSQLIFALSVKL